MKTHVLLWVSVSVLTVAVALLFASTSVLRNEIGTMHIELASVRDSLALVHRVVDSLKAQQPGLGEYMTTMQLHAAKLWFAAGAANWKLAGYELAELDETMVAAEALHARRDSVDVSSVLESVRRTQLPVIGQLLRTKSTGGFIDAYGQTLAACNGCHRPAGYGYIHIIIPASEPVTSQQWKE